MDHPFKYLIVFWILISINHSKVSAQSGDFFEGFIVTQKYDTINGRIKGNNSKENQENCIFWAVDSLPMVVYTPEEIIGYQVKNRNEYVSKLIKVNRNNPVQVFVERIVRGKINLYRYFKSNKVRYFIDKVGEDRFMELIEERNLFRGILNYVFADCENANAGIFELTYSAENLKEKIIQYNNCNNLAGVEGGDVFVSKEEINEVNKNRSGRIVSFGPEFGGGLDQINFSSLPALYRYLDEIDFKTYKSLNLGFFYKRSIPNFNNKLDVGIELLYGFRKFKGESEVLLSANMAERNYALLKMHSLMVPFTLNYKPFAWEIDPFFELGISPRFGFGEVNSRVYEEEINNIVTINESTVFELKSMEIALNVGLGASIKISNNQKIGVKVRYLLGNGLDNELASSTFSTTSNIQLLFSYQFIK